MNFNTKSAKAWGTLIAAVLTGVAGILSALGVHVDNDLMTTISGVVTAVLALLVTSGILVAPTDKKEEDKK